MSFFESVQLLPDDPIYGLPAIFAKDPRPTKVNLGIGVYQDSEGKPSVLNCVRKAEQIILDRKLDKSYQPIDGNAEFLKQTLFLIFGSEGKAAKAIENNEIFAAQTIGGTGALRLGSEFLNQEISKTVFSSTPSWPNHQHIFNRAGMQVQFYTYYNEKTHVIDFPRMCEAIRTMHPGSVIMLQASCHNPTGMDLSLEQWKELSVLIKAQKIIPFFDLAYQGFGEGLDEDVKAVRHFFNEGHEMAVAYSYSKNFGLYGERLGALAIVTHNKEAARHISSQVKQIIRGIYSSPPLQGSRIVATVLTNPDLTKEWKVELSNMRTRVKEMRKGLVAGLLAQSNDRDFSFLSTQEGLFSFCGLNPEQVSALRKDFGIFMPDNGRINVAGLTSKNMEYVIKSILTVLHS